MQAKRKATLLLDSDVWREFQDEVMRFEGPRSASSEVEKLLRGQDPEAFADALQEVFPRPPGGFPSLEEVERMRPKLRGDIAAALIREERDAREDRILGLQRNRKAIPRRKRH